MCLHCNYEVKGLFQINMVISLWVDLIPINIQKFKQIFCTLYVYFHNISKSVSQETSMLVYTCACVCFYVGNFYLFRFEARGHPSVFLQSAAGVVVGGGVPLEVKHELRHRPLHVQSHHHRLIPLPTAHTQNMSLNRDFKSQQTTPVQM